MDPGDPRPPPQAAGSDGAPPSPSDPATAPLHERFASASTDARLAWVNRPAAATHSPSTGLRIVPLPGADWGANTGRQPRAAATDGAFLGAPFLGGFDAAAGFVMRHRHDWDQAGLMVHVTDDCWLKINAERVPGGGLVLATAVTNGGWTDLATWPLEPGLVTGRGGGGAGDAGAPGSNDTVQLLLRVRVADGGDVALAWAPASSEALASGGGGAAAAGVEWRRVRLAHLHAASEPGTPVRVGPYALAPSRAGFIADVRWVTIQGEAGSVVA